MNTIGFADLCHSAAARLDRARHEVSEGTCEFILSGVSIGLYFDPLLSDDRILCHVDIGRLPDSGREEIYERLLALNLLTGSKTSGVYGLDPHTDRLIFAQQFIYPDLMDAEELALILSEYSVHARDLRQTLLDPENLVPLSDTPDSQHDQRVSTLA